MTTIETKKFDAEVGKVLQIVINSLYTNKDAFLRELISNSSDACDKLRYLAVTSNELVKDDPEFKIRIVLNEKNRTVTIIDNGIGMNKADLINNIGTIASSGTQNFLDMMKDGNKGDMQLIGQFGVGFYSGFMVADNIIVRSRKVGEQETWEWQSSGDGEYTIADIDDAEFSRGTSITLHIREGLDEYLDKFRVRHIITTYSDHVAFPIELTDSEGNVEVVNSASALWMRNKSDISDDQYREFYKQVAHLPDIPWMTIHNKNEGAVEFTNLLFIPTMKPFDLFNPERKGRIKLYIKRVFIAEEGIDIIPAFLRFLRGVVDSEDLPLNVSRESLQHNNTLSKISRTITLKVIAELRKKLENERENYESFWKDFGQVLKEGLCEANDFKEKMLEICLFRSALNNKFITFDEYKSNMKEGQEAIYYLCGEEAEKLKNSPQLEGFLKNNIDVLLFEDTVDDFWVNVVNSYKNSELKSVTRAGTMVDDLISKNKPETEQSEQIHDYTELLTYCKTVLGGMVKEVRISGKLVDSPVCLSVAEGAMDIRMEKYLLEQKQIKSISSKILELNPNHFIIKMINEQVKSKNLESTEDLIKILYDQACIIENQPVADPGAFAKRINRMLEGAF